MFEVKQPFYKVDEGTESGDWYETLSGAVVDDGQPDEEPDTEVLEDEETTETVDEQDETETVEEEAEETEDSPNFDDETEVDLGEGRQPVKLSELKQGYLRQSDYTKKTQELATQRKELEATMEQVKPAQEFMGFINQNPYLFNQIQQAIEHWNNSGVLPIEEVMQDAESAKYINYYMAENQKLTDRLKELEAKAGELELSSTFTSLRNDLKAEYGDLVTDEYISTLQDRAKAESLPQSVIRDIAEAHLAKEALKKERMQSGTVKKQTEAKTVQSLQESRKKAPPSPKSQGQRPSKDDTPTDGSWFEALRAAAKR
jgi:hypothetical protein